MVDNPQRSPLEALFWKEPVEDPNKQYAREARRRNIERLGEAFTAVGGQGGLVRMPKFTSPDEVKVEHEAEQARQKAIADEQAASAQRLAAASAAIAELGPKLEKLGAKIETATLSRTSAAQMRWMQRQKRKMR
jgi:hypothetical protein